MYKIMFYSFISVLLIGTASAQPVPPDRNRQNIRPFVSGNEKPLAIDAAIRQSLREQGLVVGGNTTGVVSAELDLPVQNSGAKKSVDISKAFLSEHLSSIAPNLQLSELQLAPLEDQCTSAPGAEETLSDELTYVRVIDGIQVLGGQLNVEVSPTTRKVTGFQNTMPTIAAKKIGMPLATSRFWNDANDAKPKDFKNWIGDSKQRLIALKGAKEYWLPVNDGGQSGLVRVKQVAFIRDNKPMMGLLLPNGKLAGVSVIPHKGYKLPAPNVYIDPATNLPSFISYRPVGGFKPSSAGLISNPAEIALRYLEENPSMYRTGKARCQFKIADVRKDPALPRLSFVKLQQRIAGRPVFGSQLIFEIQDGATIMSIQGHTLPNANMPLTPAISATQAKQKVVALVEAGFRSSTTPEERNGRRTIQGDAELVVFAGQLFPRKNARPMANRLAYKVRTSEVVWLIDAITNQPLYAYSLRESANIVNDGGARSEWGRLSYTTSNINGVPVAGATTNTDTASAVAAIATTAAFYAGHGWLGQNGGGSNFVVNTNVALSIGCFNAFYTAFVREAFFCLGAGTSDIVGHELTHGVIGFTSDLIYADESGALNESYADIMGNLAFPDALAAGATVPGWLVGETSSAGSLRNMAIATSYAAYSSRTDLGCAATDFAGSGCDAGGVHTNSAINNRAHVLMSDGGVGAMTGMGRSKLRSIAFNVMTSRLVNSSRLIDAALASKAACDAFVALGANDLAGTPFVINDCDQVPLAFQQVGLDPDLVTDWVPPALGFSGTIVQFPGETTDNGCALTDISLQMDTPSGLLDANAAASPGGIPVINYLGLMTATIAPTTPPIGSTVKTHTIAWTNVFGQTPNLRSSVSAPPPAGALNCVTPANMLPVTRVSGSLAETSLLAFPNSGTLSTGNAASAMNTSCVLRRTEVQLVDSDNVTVLAGPGPVATQNVVIWNWGVKITITRSATIGGTPPGLVGGSFNLSAPVTWTRTAAWFEHTRWQLVYDIDQPAGVTCTP